MVTLRTTFFAGVSLMKRYASWFSQMTICPFAHLFGVTHTFQVFAVGFIVITRHKLKGFFCGEFNFLHSLQVVMHSSK